jgi:hypothetical protein
MRGLRSGAGFTGRKGTSAAHLATARDFPGAQRAAPPADTGGTLQDTPFAPERLAV